MCVCVRACVCVGACVRVHASVCVLACMSDAIPYTFLQKCWSGKCEWK